MLIIILIIVFNYLLLSIFIASSSFPGKGGDSDFRGVVQWYTRKTDLPLPLRKKMTTTDENELFINQKGFDREIDLETILGIIEVCDECCGYLQGRACGG